MWSFGKRFATLNFIVSLKNFSDYSNRFNFYRLSAKLNIDIPMSGWFGKRFYLLKVRASLLNS